MYCAIIGDLVKSKNITPPERDKLQNKLNKLLIKINNDYKNDIVAKFIITLGDEFQGLLSASYISVEIIEKIIKELYPHNVRFGIGISDIYTDIKPEGAFFADGPAYYYARDAITKLKKAKNLSDNFAVRYDTGENDEKLGEEDREKRKTDVLLANRICKLIDTLMTGWTPKQRETIGKMIDTSNQQNRVAKTLEVNSSTVSRQLAAASYKDYKESMNDLSEYLRNKFDFAIKDDELANAASLHNTGVYLLGQYKYDEALQKLQQALDNRINKSAREVEIAETYNTMGDVYYAQRDYNNALTVYEKALNIRKKVLGDDHPDTADCYNNIGVVYSKLGDYPKALECHTKALNIRKKILGEDHPDTAISYDNIALVYDNLDNCDEALKFYIKALSVYEKREDVSAQYSAYNNIAEIYGKLKNTEKELEYMKKAININNKMHDNKNVKKKDIEYDA